MEVCLLYLGKKNPRVVDTPLLTAKYTFYKEPVWVKDRDAEWLMVNNPKMFQKLGERGDEAIEDAEDIKPKPELEVPDIEQLSDLVCDKCGKTYKNSEAGKRWYDRHIESCTGE